MKNFSSSEFGKATWYLHRFIAKMDTQLSYPCSQATPSTTSSNDMIFGLKGLSSWGAFNYDMELKRRGSGIFEWWLERLPFKGMMLKNITLQVSCFRD
jgi:hypothetical protein